jgi:DNA-binding transcriptional ArsR family regulator
MLQRSHRTLKAEAEIAAYLHRSRMAILDALRSGPATASQIAQRMGVHPANLTRHLRILERAGLIALVDKRDTGRNLEKYYAAVAASFDVAPNAANLETPHKIALDFARSDLSAALTQLPDDPRGTVKVHVVEASVAPANVAAFAKELAVLAKRFAAADGRGSEAYHIVLALYPGAVNPGAPLIRLSKRRKSSHAKGQPKPGARP